MSLNIDAKYDLNKSVDTTVNNLTNKPALALGNGISSIINLVFSPFTYLEEKQRIRYQAKIEKFQEEIDAKISNIPPENYKELNMQITGIALENSKYCLESDELRNMFANLIAKSMDSRFSSITHPSFAEIIKQMSPLDAQNLTLFQEGSLPIVEYRLSTPDENGKKTGTYGVIQTNVFLSNNNVEDVVIQAESISNLERLGLIHISYDEYFADENKYANFSNTYIYNYHKSHGNTLNIQKGNATATPLGKSFIKVCLK